MTDLTAIDILIDPDVQAIERAQVINARLLESLPQGWALDDTHKPSHHHAPAVRAHTATEL